jgi:antirestriction protein ArdC
MLIALQRPEATHVAGFRTWKKLGRQVNKGEKGIQILAPITHRQKIVLENDEEQEDEKLVAFRPCYVFDISQTSGKPIPAPARLRGDPGVFMDRLLGFVAERGIELRYSTRLGRTEGASMGGTIVLNASLDVAPKFGTLVHEVAHEMLHQGDDRTEDRKVRETEAEAVAFVVSTAVGLEPGTSSSDYLLTYQTTPKTLLESLTRIRRAAAQIIDAITVLAESTVTQSTEHGHAVAA